MYFLPAVKPLTLVELDSNNPEYSFNDLELRLKEQVGLYRVGTVNLLCLQSLENINARLVCCAAFVYTAVQSHRSLPWTAATAASRRTS